MTENQPATAPVNKRGVLQRIFGIVAIIHAVMVVIQPITAGMSMDGDTFALDLHYWNGMSIMTVAVIQLILGVLWFKPGGGPSRAITISLVLLALEVAQFLIGDSGHMAIHLPLGIILLFGVLGLIRMSFRDYPAPGAQVDSANA